jgi:flavin reductase ActVB
MPYPPVDPLDFRTAMSRFASGVTVVTTRDDSGVRSGFTASAFSSLSLDPPLVLVCLERRADCFEAFEAAATMGISILAAGHDDVALRFATKGADKFGGSEMEDGPVTGMPLVKGALAQVECEMYSKLDGGDHLILVGRVVGARVAEAEPLLHYNRAFGAFVAG